MNRKTHAAAPRATAQTPLFRPPVLANAAEPAGVALAQQLHEVAIALNEIRRGRSGTAVLERVPSALRPGVQSLLFQVLRALGWAEAVRQQLAPRAPAPAVDALLCTALALLADEEHPPYAPFTLVNQAVQAAKQDHATRAQAPFINACLRRFLRERGALQQAVAGDLRAKWNHPLWRVAQQRTDHPQN